MTPKFVVLVEFAVRPGAGGRFKELVLENAAASVRDEPGCQRFDVLLDRGESPDRITLYEIYDDEAAFEAHLKTPHFAIFKAAVADIVQEQVLRKLDVWENLSA